MIGLGTVIVVYAVAVCVSALLILGLDRYLNLERCLGLDPWRPADFERGLSIRPAASGTVENPVICPDCGALNEHEYPYCGACVSKLPHARV